MTQRLPFCPQADYFDITSKVRWPEVVQRRPKWPEEAFLKNALRLSQRRKKNRRLTPHGRKMKKQGFWRPFVPDVIVSLLRITHLSCIWSLLARVIVITVDLICTNKRVSHAPTMQCAMNACLVTLNEPTKGVGYTTANS
jgi:hypothetical protein